MDDINVYKIVASRGDFTGDKLQQAWPRPLHVPLLHSTALCSVSSPSRSGHTLPIPHCVVRRHVRWM